jgi:hypothetical protein
MIDVDAVLRDIPHFETFCSVDKLHDLVGRLREDPRFDVRVVGKSVNGVPIHHIRFGKGKVKALFVAFPHPMEPIGGMTVFSLMTLLSQGHRALVDADVEWNIVPCIDPDGAILNEPWSQNFSFERYLQNYYLQSARDQADMSFPISHKKLVVNQPSQEARVLKSVIDACLPDFYTTLHNTRVGGAFYLLSRDIDRKYHQQLYRLLEQQRFPLQTRPPWKEVGARYGDGIGEVLFTKKIYDYLEQTTPSPESYELIRYGGESWDYMAEIRPEALTFVPEMGCLRHPCDESETDTGINLRWFKLRIDADSKYLATVLLEEWEAVKDDLDVNSPFYRAILGGTVLPAKEEIANGGWPMSRYPTRDILFNPKYDKLMTEGDMVNVCVVDSGLYFVQWSYQFLRLLKTARQTPRVQQAIARSEQAFNQVRAEIARYIDMDGFAIVERDTLARVQLGSGLIALNSVLETRRP